jgi:hypothetical protein
MKTIIAAVLMALVASLGCSDKTTIKTEKTIKTPRGEKTVIKEREVQDTGNPNPQP